MFRIAWLVACAGMMLACLLLAFSFIIPFGWGPALGSYSWGLGPGIWGLGILFFGMCIVGGVVCLAQPDARRWCSSWMFPQGQSFFDVPEKRDFQAGNAEEKSEG